MTTGVDPDWWKELFDEVYLQTDARSVCDDDVTHREVDLLLELLPLSPHHEILDLCGGHGRHSIELARRGFAHCTVFDYSQFLVDKGSAEAGKRGMEIRFLQGDARQTGLPSDRFDRILILGNSLGYLPPPDGDRQILAEALRLMKRGGRLLLDVVNGAVLKGRFTPAAWHEIGEDLVVCRTRTLAGDLVRTREMVLSKKRGLIRDRYYSLALHDPESMARLLADLGFCDVEVTGDFSPFERKGDFGFMNFRMVVTAGKP